jgi:hypothetical protein
MTLVRKRLSKSGWILLALVIVVIIAMPILHFTGAFNMGFLDGWAVSGAQWAAMSGINVLIVSLILFGMGFGVCYVLKDYVIGVEGNNLAVTNTGNNYTPLGANPAPNNSGTVVNA